jgi:hypothetical protein
VKRRTARSRRYFAGWKESQMGPDRKERDEESLVPPGGHHWGLWVWAAVCSPALMESAPCHSLELLGHGVREQRLGRRSGHQFGEEGRDPSRQPMVASEANELHLKCARERCKVAWTVRQARQGQHPIRDATALELTGVQGRLSLAPENVASQVAERFSTTDRVRLDAGTKPHQTCPLWR